MQRDAAGLRETSVHPMPGRPLAPGPTAHHPPRAAAAGSGLQNLGLSRLFNSVRAVENVFPAAKTELIPSEPRLPDAAYQALRLWGPGERSSNTRSCLRLRACTCSMDNIYILHIPVLFRGGKLILNSGLKALRYTHAAERKGGGKESPHLVSVSLLSSH